MANDSQANQRPSVRGSLRLRLSVMVAVAVVGVSGVGVLIDYPREYRLRLANVIGSLQEQAHALDAARARIGDSGEFALYVDEFCAQMNTHISPGHHVLVIDSEGRTQASTHHHSGPAVEQALLGAEPGLQVIGVEGHQLAHARLTGDDGVTIITAQYLDHMERILRRQLTSRAATAGATAVGIIALVILSLHLGVIRPLSRLAEAARAWATRDFSARVDPVGPSELRLLCDEFNAMARDLAENEHARLAELGRARRIQANLLPTSLPPVPSLEIAARYLPAEHVAGDLYDIFATPDGATAVAVLDVAGHGITAALLTGLVRMSLRCRLAEKGDPASALEAVNADLLSCVSEGQFVTVCLGVWNPSDRSWTYATGGHPGGVWLNSDGARHLPHTGPLLGVLTDGSWTNETVRLAPGDRLLIYTDGVVDAGAGNGERLGSEGLAELLQGSADLDVEGQLAAVVAHLRRLSPGTPEDDVTLVCLHVLG